MLEGAFEVFEPGKPHNPFDANALLPRTLLATWRKCVLFLLFLLAACGGDGGGSGGAGGGSGGDGGGTSQVTLNSVAISPANPTLAIETTSNLVLTGTYSDGSTRDLSAGAAWASSTPNVATVSGGAVAALAEGTTTISATYNGLSASTLVTVKAGALSFIYSFGPPPDASQPNGPLLLASDGNFYGTSRAGGAHSCRNNEVPCGAVFKITPAGKEIVLSSFGTDASDAYSPNAALIQGKDGALYGTTADGGTFGQGTVFKITTSGVRTILYSFGATPNDGVTPVAPLIQANDGNFYGTTASGGSNHCANIPQDGGNCGTIFKVTPQGVETVVYSFGAFDADGAEPLGSLLQASDGNFYGTTIDGGAND